MQKLWVQMWSSFRDLENVPVGRACSARAISGSQPAERGRHAASSGTGKWHSYSSKLSSKHQPGCLEADPLMKCRPGCTWLFSEWRWAQRLQPVAPCTEDRWEVTTFDHGFQSRRELTNCCQKMICFYSHKFRKCKGNWMEGAKFYTLIGGSFSFRWKRKCIVTFKLASVLRPQFCRSLISNILS